MTTTISGRTSSGRIGGAGTRDINTATSDDPGATDENFAERKLTPYMIFFK